MKISHFIILIVIVCAIIISSIKVKTSKIIKRDVETATAIILDKGYNKQSNEYTLTCFDVKNKIVYQILEKQIWDKVEIKDSIVVTFNKNKLSGIYTFLDAKVMGKSKQKLGFRLF